MTLPPLTCLTRSVLAATTLLWALYPGWGLAVLWPVVTESEITTCKDQAGKPCSTNVYYRGVVSILDLGVATHPPANTRGAAMHGIHCDWTINGVHSGCTWGDNNRHRPKMSGCELSRNGAWLFENVPKCQFLPTWGPHSGAGPGAECSMVGVPVGNSSLSTPFGVFDATTVANAGSTYCVKSLPPNTPCKIDVLPELRHGTLPPDTVDTRTVVTRMDCGASPTVSLMGASELRLGQGLAAKLFVSAEGTNTVKVTSTLTAVGAPPGSYHGDAVIVVAPR